MTVVVGEASKPTPTMAVVKPSITSWNSSLILSGVLVAGTLSAAGYFNRNRLTSMYSTWRTGRGWVGADAHNATVEEIQMQRDVAEREVENLREKGERY